MKNFFVNRVVDIWQVAKHCGVSVDFAFDRYYADVVNGESVETNTDMPGYDFAAVKAEWDLLSEKDQNIAVETYKDFVSANYEKVCELWRENDIEGIKALAAEYAAR